MLKILGQFLLAAAMTGFMPVDAAQLEWQAGVENGLEFGRLPVSQTQQLFDVEEPEEKGKYPKKVDVDSYGIVTSAQSAIVMDVESGMILLAERPDQVRSIGSVTKLMSALVFLETQPNLSSSVELDANLDIVYGGRIYLKFGADMLLEDVLAASLVGSDNSATQSLVRFSGMTEEEFIAEMNRKAEELGMTSTVFKDPTGIDPGNMSTARELITLLSAAERTPEIKKYMTSSEVTITQEGGIVVPIENTNKILGTYLNEGEYAVEAGKTGYLPQAGYVLATTISENDHAVHVIVLGTDSPDARIQEVKGLATWAFKTFSWPEE